MRRSAIVMWMVAMGAWQGACGSPKAIDGENPPPRGEVLPVGELRVEVVWNEPWWPTEVVTRLLPRAVSCDGAPSAPVGEREARHSPRDVVSFVDLPAGSTWTVHVVGFGTRGAVVGEGCVEKAHVVGKDVHTVSVPLRVRFGSPYGTYAVTLEPRWEPTVGNMELRGGLEPFLELLEDPASHLTEYWLDALVDAGVAPTRAAVAEAIEWAWLAYVMVGGQDINGDGTVNLADADVGGPFGVDVSDPIRHLLYGRAVPWEFGELRELLDTVTIDGHVTIERGSEDRVLAQWTWDTLRWFWPNGDMAVLGAAESALPVADSAVWMGIAARHTADGVSWVAEIPAHELQLPIAPWVERAVTGPLLERATGQPTLACAMEATLGCTGPYPFVCGGGTPGCGCERAAEALQSVGVLADSARAACLDVLSRASSEASRRLEAKLIEAVGEAFLNMEGKLWVRDVDGDLRGDTLDGEGMGELWTAGAPTSVELDFVGQRTP